MRHEGLRKFFILRLLLLLLVAGLLLLALCNNAVNRFNYSYNIWCTVLHLEWIYGSLWPYQILLQLRNEKKVYWVMIDQFSSLILIWSLNIRHNMVYSFFYYTLIIYWKKLCRKVLTCHHHFFFNRFFLYSFSSDWQFNYVIWIILN